MPLTTKRKTWDMDAETTQLKLNAKSGALVQFTDNFYILYGNEEPELFLQFCMIYREWIWNNNSPDHETKQELLLKMCSGAAKQAVCDVLSRTNMQYTRYADKDKYTWNCLIIKHWQSNMLDVANNTQTRSNYHNYYNGNLHLVNVYNNHILQEVFYQLSLTIFGSNSHGQNTCIYVKLLIRSMKCIIEGGIG